MANGFRVYPRPTGASRGSDPDAMPPAEEFGWLTDNFRASDETVRRLALDYWSGRFCVGEFGQPFRRWVLPLRTGMKPGESGPMTCPACLAQDQDPYWRIYWRFAFVTHCPEHGSRLIDRCPECGQTLWPAGRPAKAATCWIPLSCCHRCGAELASAEPGPADLERRLNLWGVVQADGRDRTSLGPACTPAEYLDAIWSLGQLLLRRRSSHLWEHLPAELGPPVLELPDGRRIDRIEGLPVLDRERLLGGVLWLLDEWPDRFAETCRAAKVSRTDFGSTRRLHPPWLNAAIDEQLTYRRRGWVTEKDVDRAIAQVRGAGEKPSKAAVRRTLDVSESRAVDAECSQRRHASVTELLLLCGAFEKRLQLASRARDQRATLTRDYLTFLLSVLAGERIEIVCGFYAHDVDEVLQASLSSGGGSLHRRMLALRAAQLNVKYREFREARVTAQRQEADVWLISRGGTPLAGHSVRARVAGLVSECLPGDLWASVGAFLGCLGNKKPEGRRQKRRQYEGLQGELF